jgi:hypothetical protein
VTDLTASTVSADEAAAAACSGQRARRQAAPDDPLGGARRSTRGISGCCGSGPSGPRVISRMCRAPSAGGARV